MSNSLWPHGLQHARLPCPSLFPEVCSNSCPLSRWCHSTISSCHPLLLLPSIFPSIRVFSNESVLCIRWPKYWSFSISISPSNEYSGLISIRTEWFDLPALQGTLKSLLQHHISLSLYRKALLCSYPTLWDPMDCSLPGSSVHGIFQARILEWVAIPFSRGSSWPRDRTCVSCFTGEFVTVGAIREALLAQPGVA